VNILHGKVLQIDYTQQVEMKVTVPQQEALTLTAQLQAELCDFKML